MADFRWTLNNTVSGTLVIGEPQGWKEIELQLVRDLTYHGVFSEFTNALKFTCARGAVQGGKEYIDNIYETQGVDALVTLLIEYRCDDGTFDTLFTGKLNLSEYRTGVDGNVAEFTEASVERNDITQIVKNRADTKVNLNELLTLDGTVMNAYTNAPLALAIRSQTITLDSEIDGGVFTDLNLFDGVIRPQFITGVAEQLFFQSNTPVVQDDLVRIIENPDFHDKLAAPTAPVRSILAEFYDSKENKIIQWPETFTVSWDIAGNYSDTIPIVQTRTLATQLDLFIVYGSDLVDAQLLGNVIALGNIPGYTTALLNFTVPFAFAGSQAITMQQGWKMWLFWQTIGGTGYVVTTGPGPHTVGFTFAYTRSETILNVDSTQLTQNISSFAIYESWARVSESITDQVSFAFKSDFYGRTDAEPNAGGAPTYLSDGCGSFNFIVSGISLRSYKYLGKITPLPDWSTINELFNSCSAIHNIGLGVEVHGGQDVVRVEDLAYFYDSTQIIQLNNVPEIQYFADPERFINEFEIGFEKWEPENFDGLDEINTKHLYHLPITTLKKRLTALSPYLTAGYVIEIMKRLNTEDKLDTKYDNNMFFINVVRFFASFISARSEDFSGGSGFDNVTSRHNRRLTPKHNFLRWLNVLGAGIAKTAGATIDFAQGEDNYDIFNTMNSIGCPGDYTGNPLDEDGDIAWDDANARLNAPLWVPEIYEFDFPLTFTQYQTIRNAPRGFIAFSDSTTNHIHGFILEIKYKLAGGLTHFKLLRRFVP